MKAIAIAAAIAAILAVAAAEVAPKDKCEGVDQGLCSIDELRITPCSKKPCILKRGRNASMEFDYTPNFSTDALTTAVYWAGDPAQIPFPSVGVIDACPHTTCPVVAGQQSKLTYGLYIGKKLPKGTFTFKWKVWNTNNSAQLCCFETTVKLQ